MHRRIIFGVISLVGIGSGFLLGASSVDALSKSDWQAGRIIDDAIFQDTSRMSVADIQNFLNSKVPSCDTNGMKTSEYGGGTRAQYGTAHGNPPPYTCLRDYSQDGISAAQLIYNTAQTYHINPQVLIVLLQKEQNLVLDDWPWAVQYQSATGYGCPDTAPCDTQYYGLRNQLTWAAHMFNSILNNDPNWFTPYTTGNNYIKLHPDFWNTTTQTWEDRCGGSTVNIQNRSTEALYSYTPYQPNDSALTNLYGNGDDCSSYGNRNFWRYFNDWFGPTLTSYSTSDAQWNREELDGSISTAGKTAGDYGLYSTTVTLGGTLHTLYYDATAGNLKHAWADSSGWHFAVIDGDSTDSGKVNSDVGKYVAATVYNGTLKVAYYDATNTVVRLATMAADGSWTYQTLDGDTDINGKYKHDVGRGISLVQYGNTLQVFYLDATWGNLRHAWSNDGTNWLYENIDGDYGSIARFDGNLGQSPYVNVYGSGLQLFYYDSTHGDLRHAWSDSRGWHFEDLDGSSASISRAELNTGLYPNFTTYNGTLQLYYYNETSSALRHAWADSSGWHFEDLDGTIGSVAGYDSMVGKHPFVTIANGTLRVYYFDETLGTIREARATSMGWKFGQLDGLNTAVTRQEGALSEQVSGSVYGNTLQLFDRSSATGTLRHLWADF